MIGLWGGTSLPSWIRHCRQQINGCLAIIKKDCTNLFNILSHLSTTVSNAETVEWPNLNPIVNRRGGLFPNDWQLGSTRLSRTLLSMLSNKIGPLLSGDLSTDIFWIGTTLDPFHSWGTLPNWREGYNNDITILSAVAFSILADMLSGLLECPRNQACQPFYPHCRSRPQESYLGIVC